MKYSLFFFILSVALLNHAEAQVPSGFSLGGVAIPVRDTGNNTIIELIKADSTFNFNIAVASFAPQKRLAWHSHPGGQILLITEGIGYYQERGQPKQIVRKGEITRCLPGVEHWHGASEESGVTYMATSPAQNGPTKWFQPVTESEYKGR